MPVARFSLNFNEIDLYSEISVAPSSIGFISTQTWSHCQVFFLSLLGLFIGHHGLSSTSFAKRNCGVSPAILPCPERLLL